METCFSPPPPPPHVVSTRDVQNNHHAAHNMHNAASEVSYMTSIHGSDSACSKCKPGIGVGRMGARAGAGDSTSAAD